jgi:hypothetical protein
MAALLFVISTGAKRSGEISVWMLSLGNVFRGGLEQLTGSQIPNENPVSR